MNDIITSITWDNVNDYVTNLLPYLPTIEKEFDLLFNAFLEKIKSMQKTAEYKKFHADCMKTVAPYVFPMKKYFGNDRNIQYECFNQLIQEFENDYLESSTTAASAKSNGVF